MVAEEVGSSYGDYVRAEEKLLKALHTLQGGDEPWRCKKREKVEVISYDRRATIVLYCLDCGGYVERDESMVGTEGQRARAQYRGWS